MLPVRARLSAVEQALAQEQVTVFPVLDDNGCCEGLVSRERLEAATRAHQSKETGESAGKESTDEALQIPKLIENLCRRPSSNEDGPVVPVYRLMDPVPYSLYEDMPAARLYPLFAGGLFNEAVIISKQGDFRGILCRRNLVS